MSALSTLRSDLELYLAAHEAASRDMRSSRHAAVTHSLVLTRQLISAVDRSDIASALHITFCQTINLLSLSTGGDFDQGRNESPQSTSDSGETGDEQGLFDRLVHGRSLMGESLPWFSFTYARYCDGLWSSSWGANTRADRQGNEGRAESEPVDPLMFDIVCDFAQLTETLLGRLGAPSLPESL